MKGKFPNGLKAAMEAKEIGPSELARAVDTSKQNVQRWADAERRLVKEWAEKLAPHLGVTPQSLIFDNVEDDDPDGRVRRVPIEDDEAEHARTGEDGPETSVSSVGPYRGRLPGAIPDLDVRGGAGPGEVATPYTTTDGNGISYSAEAVRGEIVLPDYLLGEYTRSRPGRVHSIRVHGDSMETTLTSGDRVFADTADTAVGAGGVFVVVDHRHGEVLVKRIRREGKGETAKIILVSDNPKQGNDERDPDEVTIVGRAIARLTRL